MGSSARILVTGATAPRPFRRSALSCSRKFTGTSLLARILALYRVLPIQHPRPASSRSERNSEAGAVARSRPFSTRSAISQKLIGEMQSLPSANACLVLRSNFHYRKRRNSPIRSVSPIASMFCPTEKRSSPG